MPRTFTAENTCEKRDPCGLRAMQGREASRRSRQCGGERGVLLSLSAPAWALIGMCLGVRALFLSRRDWRGRARDGTDLLVVLLLGVLWGTHQRDPLVVYGLDIQHGVLWARTLPIALGLGLVANLCHLIWRGRSGSRESRLAARQSDYGSQWLPNAPAVMQSLAGPYFIAVHTLLEELLFRGVVLLGLTHALPTHVGTWNLIQAGAFALLHTLPLMALGERSALYLATVTVFSASAGWTLGVLCAAS